MKLIRELHETLKEDYKLIIFCDNKILYDQAENTYSFEIKDLNFTNQLGPYLAIAFIDSCCVYVLDIKKDQNILRSLLKKASINESEIKNFKMYGSARKLYNFNIDNVSEY